MKIINDIFSFIDSNHLWFLGILAILVLMLFIMLIVSMSHVRREKRNYADSLSKHSTEIDSLEDELSNLKSKIFHNDEIIATLSKENTSLKNESLRLNTSINTLNDDLENSRASESELSENLQSVILENEAKVADLVDKLKTANLNNNKITTELKETKKALADAENKYIEDLNNIKTSSGKLAEEFSNFKIDSLETVQKLKDEIKAQKEVNNALVVALNEIRGKDSTDQQQLPNNVSSENKTEKIENLKRKDIAAIAKSIGIEGVYKMKKDDIIEAINLKLTNGKTSKIKKSKTEE